ncbi:MAG: YihY/virulence factor BrkB family protein [Nocardioides sp.]|uniref:YihY/virulence factor BrkB family protein n=1 Tax=Nocardioides sp. TaxID=35761 RepID=UPI0039E38E4E
MGVVGSLDRGQRRFPPVGFPLGVIYKFFDDQGNYLAAVVTYYAFIAIFPLMLLGTSILGFFLQGNPDLQEKLLDSALSQFPIIGTQLGQPESIQGSTGGVIAGSLAATYGAMGLGQAIQNTLNTAWSVPRNSRPNPFLLRLRSLVVLATAGVAVLAISLVSTLGANTQLFGGEVAGMVRWLIALATVLLVGSMLTVLFRLGTARDHPLKSAAPGAFTMAVLWQILQWGGAVYVDKVINGASGMNATFATVLGLIAFIYIAAVMGVLSIEVNVVIVRHLWPRALLTPFTDAVDLTDADRRAYASYALMNRHKGFQTVAVSFDGRDGGTHEIVMDPSWARKPHRRKRDPDPFGVTEPDPHSPGGHEHLAERDL